jgi:phytoene dehydrogenase-like protein
MARQKVAIIGGGIAGLAAGCYLRMNGYDTEIFEMHTLPGGLCTAWTRKGYTFDFCIHWLMGSGPSKNLHAIWKDLGAIEGRKFIEWEVYETVVLENKKSLTVYTDPDRFYQELAAFAPEDKALCRSLCNAIKKAAGFDFPIRRGKTGIVKSLVSMIKMMFFIPLLMKWGKMTLPQLIAQFKSEELKQAFKLMYSEEVASDFPVTGMIVMLAFMYKKSSGYPLGGSLEFAKAIERRYTTLGGEIRYGFEVDKILVENGSAIGLTGNGGEVHKADIVISAADGHATLFEMLEGKYLTQKISQAYERLRVFPSLVYVCLGISRDLRSHPHMTAFTLSNPIRLENGALMLNKLSLRLFHFDPSMAPQGCTAAIVMIPTFNTSWWTDLRMQNPTDYNAEKKRIGEQIVDAIDEFLGDIRPHVEVIDVATPATIIRYTNNWKGSFEGFLPARKSMSGRMIDRTIPSLKNFYMVGQWTNPGGGLPPCGMDGLAIAQRICKEDGKKFKIK